MDTSLYLSEFEKAAGGLDASLLARKGVQVEVGIWLNSVVLRMSKKAWANKPLTRPQSDTAIFFSIWVNEKDANADRLFYNIHALKLRKLSGYKVTSREFAADFRARFKPFAQHWPNVSVDFGPLNLMEGWTALDATTVAAAVSALAATFLELVPLIDNLLEQKKAPALIRRGL